MIEDRIIDDNSKYYMIWGWNNRTSWDWAVPSSVKLEFMVEVVIEVSSWSCN